MSSPTLKQQIIDANVLVIGAGGIGCELLKNLALTGFKNITVIDLDTIDISNLNRQFLFRREHVGRSKAEVASTAISQMVPGVNIKYHHDSIMSDDFGVDFFKKFSFVLSALDNKAARSHVNRLCLVAEVPLIESGSSGYLGQVSVILKRKTECYDCVPKAAQKTYPSCTIRNTPTELVHCVVWAKSLFNQLFGEEDPDDDVAPNISDEENGGLSNGALVDENMKHDQNDPALRANTENGTSVEVKNDPIKNQINTRQYAATIFYSPKLLFDKLFYDDVNYLLSMSHLWNERKAPHPNKFYEILEGGMGGSKKLTANDVWSASKSAEIFEESIKKLYPRFIEAQAKSEVLSFDKDDDDAMNFVAACTNIRAGIFHIRGKSLFEIKAMAGNIIPAIATTNACVAGMVLVEALKIVRGEMDKCRWVYINRQPNPRGQILMGEKPVLPKPECYVCSEKREVVIQVNLEKMTAGSLRDKILIGALNMLQPDVMEIFSNRILISSEEGETDGIMNDKLKTLGIKNGSQLDCDDYKQQLNFKLIVMNSEKLEEDQFEFGNVKVEPESVEEKVNGEGPVSSSSPLLSKMDITEPNEDDGPSSLKRSRIE